MRRVEMTMSLKRGREKMEEELEKKKRDERAEYHAGYPPVVTKEAPEPSVSDDEETDE